jgi:hypothetical protein
MSVGEVHDGRRAAVAAPVTGVEVAVHDGVGQAAVFQLREPAQQPACRGQLGDGELAGDLAVEQRADLPCDDRRTPVRLSAVPPALASGPTSHAGLAAGGTGNIPELATPTPPASHK